MLRTKQQRFDIFSFPPLRPKCSSIFSINHGKIKPKIYILYECRYINQTPQYDIGFKHRKATSSRH